MDALVNQYDSPSVAAMARSAQADDEIEALRRRQEGIYLHSPKELVSHSNQERQTARDYRRREVMELLQNADDAAFDAGIAGHLLFRLSPGRLIVANTGAPFTPDGIESIVVSYASPKQFSRQRYIGNKGLGFRSVLNWTERPLIRSGPYAVSFGPEYARKRVEELANTSDSLRQRWEDLRASQGGGELPILRFPRVPDSTDPDLCLAERVLQEGYDTVLVFPFLESDGEREPYDTLGEQLDELGPEVLLFCRQLSRVTFEEEGEDTKSWEVIREVGAPVLSDTTLARVCLSIGDETQLWTVHTRNATLPPELARSAPDTPDYEVAVAVPDIPATGSEHRLCVFFPTDERVPSACLSHATLLLEANRKNPVADERINKFILERLANLWVEVAESQSAVHPFGGLVLLEGAERAGEGLTALGFPERVLARSRQAAIFPRVDGQVTAAQSIVRAPKSAWRDLLDPAWSPEALAVEVEMAAPGILAALQIGWYGVRDLHSRLERWISTLEAGRAGQVVGRLLSMGVLAGESPPAIMRLESGTSAGADLVAYLPRGDGAVTLPAWVKDFAFLDRRFVEGAREAAGLRTLRALADRFETAGYAVREFNAEGVTRHLVQALDRWTPEMGGTRADGVRDVLATLFPLIEAEPDGREVSVAVPVLTESGCIRPARDCYLGPAYPGGELVTALYAPLGKDEFVAAPADLGLPASAARVEAFLVRLGVAREPRANDVRSPYDTDDGAGYERFVLESLSYPYEVDDVTVASLESALSGIDVHFQHLTMPDRWPALLKRGDPVAILAYLAGQGEYHLRPTGQPSAWLGLSWRRQHNSRFRKDVPFPSPALYLLRTKAWVPCSDGVRRRPTEVTVAPGARRYLSKLFAEPAFDPEHPLLRSFEGRDVVREVLARLEAFWSFSDLSISARFDLLRSLPRVDPDGDIAPSIYGALLEEHATAGSADAVQGFTDDGLMWGRCGDVERYWPVKEFRYATEAAIPGPVRRQVPLVALPPRKSAAEVEALFGIRRLSRADYRISVDEALTVEQPWSGEAERWFRTLIPVLYAYRLSIRADEGRERHRFSELRVRVCSTVACAVEVGGETASDFITETYAALAVEGTLFIISNEAQFNPGPLLCDALGDALADHLGVPGEASSLAGFLHCRTPTTALELLDRRSGGCGRELLERARTQLKWTEEAPTPISLPGPEPHRPGSGEAAPPEPTTTAASPTPPTEGLESGDDTPITESTFVAQPTPVRRQGTRVAWRQQAPGEPGGTRRTIAKQSVTLPVAEEFERKAGRYPLRVHTAVGAQAFGCDIISFASQADLDAAQSAGRVDPDRVVRFIEVKGRSNRLGGVELTENEQKAAVEFGDRYFIYRVFVSPEGVEELAILGAPATSEAARLVTRYEYRLAESPRTEWFKRTTTPA